MTLLIVMLVLVLLVIVAAFVIGFELPERRYAPDGRLKKLTELLSPKADAGEPDAAAASQIIPSGSRNARIARRFAYVFLAVVGAVIALFLYGYADAAADDGEGSLNPLRAGLKTLNMNPVSRFGYMCYLKYNTGWYKNRDPEEPRRGERSVRHRDRDGSDGNGYGDAGSSRW